ncbi:PQQ-dependent sugar dehydrogenase [Candidatus Giovannonibacteria bacterium]|nr:PQQ-dependent sugar dehydrogenase [Candidatus Giovannonibacteria bacterium]
MKKILVPLAGIIALLALVYAGAFYWKNLRGVGPVIFSPSDDITEKITENSADIPLKLPEGFSISVFAKNLPGARVIEFDSLGNMWVSQTSEGQVSLLEVKDSKVDKQYAVFRNLKRPHGLAFDPEIKTKLYIAEENKISSALTYSGAGMEKIIDLPAGGNHFSRTIGFGPDGNLYISIGSTCNVCNESDNRRAKIFSLNTDGSDFKEFAKGLRNSVFFTWHPNSKKMWATDMGRDLLGDDIPPDEINIVENGKNYGWPTCYGKNIHDTNFDKNTYIRNPCMEPFETPSYIDIPAHSAPLGLAFVPQNSNWPDEYKGDLLVAYHGSWNRSTPTGYKIVTMKLSANGDYEGTEDFISGWLTADNRALGRPVDLKFGPDGALYASDDKAGVIYRISYNK